jgi:S1-C subfamily serine protease
MLGSRVRSIVIRGPFRLPDSLGGVVVGAAAGLMVVWLGAAAALQVQGSQLRRTVQDSAILEALVEALPPSSVLRALARFDPLPLLALPPEVRLPPPDGSVQRSGVTRDVAGSVVKVQSVACGMGTQGTGWVVAPDVVATNAHVIAGAEETEIAVPDGQLLEAVPVYVDARRDVALLEAPGLTASPLDIRTDLEQAEEVVLLGYPHDGPLTAAAATAGVPIKILTPDAYGRHLGLRTVVPLRGAVQRGDSGGPVVDAAGRVVAMMFAASEDGAGGFGVPVRDVLSALESPLEPVSPGPCYG